MTLQVTFQKTYVSSPIGIIPEQSLSLDRLEEKDLSRFYAFHNKNTAYTIPAKLKEKASVPTDYIHFIWLGNPIKDKYLDNISSWKKAYSENDIILWVDKDSLKDPKIISYAEKNNALLIDIEDVFKDQYTFDLSRFIQIEKNRLPPNFGAISDVYRYLIMYYLAGTYSDTDEDRLKGIDFEKEIAFSSTIFGFANDIIMTKHIRSDFWKEVLMEIKKRDEENKYFGSNQRFKATLYKTGPDMLDDMLQKNSKIYFKNQQELIYPPISSGTWLGSLPLKTCAMLASKANIENRIVKNTLLDIKEQRVFNPNRYNKIIAVAGLKRVEIVEAIYKELIAQSKQKFKITEFCCSADEQEKFKNLFEITELKVERKWFEQTEQSPSKQDFNEISSIKQLTNDELIELYKFANDNKLDSLIERIHESVNADVLSLLQKNK